MKKISVVVPCYNEENSIAKLYQVVTGIFAERLSQYDYDLILVDDYSSDQTRTIIRELCSKDRRVKAVFNAANFGFSRNVFNGLQEADGDAAFLVFGDLQDPPELLPEFVAQWEAGHTVVIGQKSASDESHVMNGLRRVYYKMIDILSDKPQIEEFNGFGLYDRKFIEVLRQIGDAEPYLKNVISEYAPGHATVEYHHRKSERGKSNFNFYRNYDFAMQGLTSSTKKLMRMATFIGAGLGIISAIYAISVLIRKLIYQDAFPAGMASIMVGVFLLGSIQLFFIGILGEYVLSINSKTTKKPRVVVGERINFTDTGNPENNGSIKADGEKRGDVYE